MHLTIPLACIFSAGAFAFPTLLDSRQDGFSYNGPLGASHPCPGVNEHTITGAMTNIQGLAPNYPNYECIAFSSQIDWIGINLALSNSSAVQAYTDPHCADRCAFIEMPQSLDGTDGQFCAQQSENGGIASWQSIKYVNP